MELPPSHDALLTHGSLVLSYADMCSIGETLRAAPPEELSTNESFMALYRLYHAARQHHLKRIRTCTCRPAHTSRGVAGRVPVSAVPLPSLPRVR